jgi:hypothetical protein
VPDLSDRNHRFFGRCSTNRPFCCRGLDWHCDRHFAASQ